MKLKDITKKVSKKNLNLLTGSSIKKRVNKKSKIISKKVKSNYKQTENVVSLHVKISEKYKGISDSIAGAIQDLPEPVQYLLTNSALKTVVASPGKSMYILENGFTFKIETIQHGGKRKEHISIKQGKEYILNTYV